MFTNHEEKVASAVDLLLSDVSIYRTVVDELLVDVKYLTDNEVFEYCTLVIDRMMRIIKKCRYNTGDRVEKFIIYCLIHQRYKKGYLADINVGLGDIPYHGISPLLDVKVDIQKMQEKMQCKRYSRLLTLSIEPRFIGQLRYVLSGLVTHGSPDIRANLFMFLGFRLHFKQRLDALAVNLILASQNR